MDQLEEFARKLNNFEFNGPYLKTNVPLPASVRRFLEQLKQQEQHELESKNDPNEVMENVQEKCASSSNSQENGELLKKKNCNKKSQKKKEQTINNNKSKMLNISDSYYTKYISFNDVEKSLANNELFEGILHINEKFMSDAYVTLPDNLKDVLISSIKLRNRALDGDKVVVEIFKKSKWLNPNTKDCQRTGKVVYITKKNEKNTVFVGHITNKTCGFSKYSTLVPRDKLLPKLHLDTSNWPLQINYIKNSKKSQQIFYAVLKDWNTGKIPTGELIGVSSTLGKLNDEINILSEHKTQEEPYPENINKYVPSRFSVEEDLKQKKD
ncbi:Nucleic acid-binding, OB-fold,Rrp44-like cold shock domain [Cinara cedri]|uniref:Nucleic acid-binding, OB-fold,Rrp44-like cold shock domain n=1 Tax=Cinara cedri TaxID=506608 RepID=A0A5E4N8K0_9HEMI|nr:Nucleic acid-binding, OB-fold,Rrp44-like cold shock domain [Cinara cedri]